MEGLIRDGEFRPLDKRGLTEETARKWSYRTARFKDQWVQVADYWDPEGTQVVAQKVRFQNKDFLVLGDIDKAGLYGQHLWKDGGRMVVITEGELDAMSISQLQQHKWPVVSILTGADKHPGAKKVVKHLSKYLDWLLRFETIVIFFDNDEAGRNSAQAAARLFPPGRAKIARMSDFKDASEALQAGKGDQVIKAMWDAKDYRPDGIVRLSEIRDKMNRPVVMGLPWFLEDLTKATFGRREGEIYYLGAGTGVGKTDIMLQQIEHDLSLGEKVGVFFLEQQTEETGIRLAGKWAKKRFHIPDAGWTEAERQAAIDAVSQDDRVFLYDSFGATDWGRIRDTIRYLKHAEGVRIFYLDHLTALAAAHEKDEKDALEEIMEEQGSLVKELGIILIGVSHLATPEGKPHEEGGRVTIRHFKGSRAIGFWSHFMFGLERNQQAEDPEERQTTTFRVLKDRYTGNSTGKVIYLGYDQETGMLYQTDPPQKKEKHAEDYGF